jgi:probable rRNA maturation factor
MKVYILNSSGERVPRAFLESWVKAIVRVVRKIAAEMDDFPETAASMLEASYLRKREFGLVFLAEDEALQLNKTYRGKAYATDVLSFEGDSDTVLGELVICPHVIQRQAEDHGLSFCEELGYMVIHGFLHLLGFEHERGGNEARQMFELQDRTFEHLCQEFEAAKCRQRRTKSRAVAKAKRKRKRKKKR